MVPPARFQDENGMWRNVIDRPGAYPEYSATAMIADGAAARHPQRGGLHCGKYSDPLAQKAWRAILALISADRRLVTSAKAPQRAA